MRKLSYKIARLLPRLVQDGSCPPTDRDSKDVVMIPTVFISLLQELWTPVDYPAVGGSASYASPPSLPGTPLPIPQLLPGTLSLPPGLVGELPKVPRHPKLDTSMARLAEASARSATEDELLATASGVRLMSGRVQVQISTHASGVERAREAVVATGGEVTGVAGKGTIMQAWVPPAALKGLTEADDIYFIRRPAYAVPLENLQAGDYTTEGVSVINADAWQTAGYSGVGVKVGIIDGGFSGYVSLLGSELPASVTVRNFVDGETDAQVDGGSCHGTACTEIIHDVAPDAQLYLAKTSSFVDLEEAVQWMKQVGVDIISTSLGWYNVTSGDGTGLFAELVEDARQHGILWATAAGNDRESHWCGSFYDPDADDVHNFSGAKNWEIDFFGPTEGTGYVIPSGTLIRGYLRWDDWENVNQDYALALVRWTGITWKVVALSQDRQSGQMGQTPTESIWYYATSSTSYGFVILRYSATRAVHLELLAPKVAPLHLPVYAYSLANLADAPDAITVAAVDVCSPYPQESYSSEGPTNGPGGTALGGFTKPDISGFANVSTASYPYPLFSGTSAATPHVAGAAALVLSAYPHYTPDQLQSFLESQAIDMGTSGMDTIYGHGRLYLGDPPEPTPTATRTATKTMTPTATSTITPTARPTATSTPTSSHTPTDLPTVPLPTTTNTPTGTATKTLTATATNTPTSTITATTTQTPYPTPEGGWPYSLALPVVWKP